MRTTLKGWTIVFDLDGTLVNTAPDLLVALNASLKHVSLPPVELEIIHGIIGAGSQAMIEQAITYHGHTCGDFDIPAIRTVFLEHYAENICEHSHVFPGVLPTLEALQEKDATLAVCTNKTQRLSDQLLHALGLHDRFAAIVGADSVPLKKPHGDHIRLTLNAAGGLPHKAVMVGDSRTDERAARNAGLPFIFVPFGYTSELAEHIASDADATVSHYSEFLSVLSALVA